MNITEIRNYMNSRGMKWPEKYIDALLFTITEMGEIVDAHMRKDPNWVRNNDRDTNIGHEFADAYQMLEIACHLATGKSLDENLLDKWASKGYNNNKIYAPYKSTDEIFADVAKIRADNPDLPEEEYKGILNNKNALSGEWGDKVREGSAKIFGFPVAVIKQSKEDEWWRGLTNAMRYIIYKDWMAGFEFAKCAVCNEPADGPYYCPDHK